MRDYTDFHKGDFTGVARVECDAIVKPFKVQALETPGWRTVCQVDSRATAETIARGYRIDNRGVSTRVTEQRRSGGSAYIAV